MVDRMASMQENFSHRWFVSLLNSTIGRLKCYLNLTIQGLELVLLNQVRQTSLGKS